VSKRSVNQASPEFVAGLSRVLQAFEPNVGQANPEVKFLIRGARHVVALTSDSAVFRLVSKGASEKQAGTGGNAALRSDAVTMKFVGAAADAKIQGEGELPGRSNYFLGKKREDWKSDVPRYSRVRYKNIYPGIGLVFYLSASGEIEYDFEVGPGADYRQIKLRFEGDATVRIDGHGQLVMDTPSGEILHQAPGVYQQRDGRRIPVSASFIQLGKNEFSFDLGAYDRSAPLIIDPAMQIKYSTYMVANKADGFLGFAVDPDGNAYIATSTVMTDFPTTSAYQSKLAGDQDIVLAKVDPTGQKLIYATYLGGSAPESAAAIAVDSMGYLYVTGLTNSTDFPLASSTGSVYQRDSKINNPTSWEGFVSKLGPSGSHLIYSTYFGNGSSPIVTSLAILNGNVYLTGIVTGPTFPTTVNAGLPSPHMSFVSELNADGSNLVFSGLTGTLNPEGIAVAPSGEIYVVGETTSSSMPAHSSSGTAAFQSSMQGGIYDGYAMKFSADGSKLLYATYIGGSENDYISAVKVVGGIAYIGGSTDSLNFPVRNPVQPTSGGSGEGFVAEINSTGSDLPFSTFLGGSNFDKLMAIDVDSRGMIYATGTTFSGNFPLKSPLQDKLNINVDVFVSKIDPLHQKLLFSTYLGGAIGDKGKAIEVDDEGNIYVFGTTSSKDFPMKKALRSSFTGPVEYFLFKLGGKGQIFLR
jgi:hypothetical protein